MRSWLSNFETTLSEWLLGVVLFGGLGAFSSYFTHWGFGRSTIFGVLSYLGPALGRRGQIALQQSLPSAALRRIAAAPLWLRWLLILPLIVFVAGRVEGILHSQGSPQWVVTCAVFGFVTVVGNFINGYSGYHMPPDSPEDRPAA